METIRLTMAQALVRWLTAQKTEIDGQVVPLFPGAFGIFGHGNVTALAEALAEVKDEFPTWRGHNEQSMALSAVAYAKAKRRKQIMVATSSIGPGCTNMVTAAGVAFDHPPADAGLALPPGVNQGMVKMLRAAYDKMNADPEFAAELKKRKLRLIPSTGEQIQKVVNDSVDNASPAVVKHARKLIFGGES